MFQDEGRFGLLGTPGRCWAPHHTCPVFLAEVAQRHADDFIVMVMDQAGWHRAGELAVPASMRLIYLPPYSPELNPVEHQWEGRAALPTMSSQGKVSVKAGQLQPFRQLALGRCSVFEQDQHVGLRQVPGPVCRCRRLRHPVELQRGPERDAECGLTFSFDVQRINYSDVAAVSNPSQVAAPLGAANGAGFGWRDIDVYKLGVQWQATPQLTLRAGYNKGDNPISSADVTFNILAPGVVTTHYTLGFTQALGTGSEITATYMMAPRQSVSGPSLLDNFFGAGTAGRETIGMKQQSIGIAWAMKF